MPINFFVTTCKSSSTKSKFGICDDPPPASAPAYIDELDSAKWIAVVNNSNAKTVEFVAIDACIDIRKPNGQLESRCDGLLMYDNDLIFVELKTWEGGKWLKKGREQLTITINNFKSSHDITIYANIYGNVCNSQRPQSHFGHAANIQQFSDDTGLILRSDSTIEIM